jgi:ATP-binding cassette, subfamily B, bacterial
VLIENVSFCYPDGRKVFNDFDLRIKPGQRVGLVGPSGSGKSTLFVLLQRLYDVQGGQIRINGEDITRVTQESLRSAIALVPQDVSTFHRSILENVRYGRPEANNEEVMEAMFAARCAGFVETLPDGVHTIMGERGVKLSPGQRQRIAIARAFLKNAPILLLDEATSALDSESEEAVREALDRLMARPHRDRDRAPAFDSTQLRSDRGAAGRSRSRGRFAGRIDAGRRHLPGSRPP